MTKIKEEIIMADFKLSILMATGSLYIDNFGINSWLLETSGSCVVSSSQLVLLRKLVTVSFPHSSRSLDWRAF